MSDRPNPEPVETVKTTSAVITAVLLGAVIGAAVTFASITACGYTLEKKEPPAQAAAQPPTGDAQAGTPGMPPGGMPGGMPQGGMPGMPGRGGPPMGMMAGMGGGGGMGGGFGGGGFGGPSGKRDLTQLVGKLELLTRGNLRVELDTDQSAKIAAKLAELDKAENMTADEAQKQFEELKGMLTASQNEAIDAVGLPFGGRGGRGGGGGGGFGGGGGRGGMMMGRGGPGGGGGSDDENPFRQEANQKRLQDMLARLKPAE